VPAWIPLAKTVLPYLTSLATSAIPAFASRKDHAKSLEAHADQTSELQAAATQSAASVKTLAEQLEKTIKAVDGGATAVEARFTEVSGRLTKIAELQAIAAQTAASAKTLSEQLEKTVKAIDDEAEVRIPDQDDRGFRSNVTDDSDRT
jgi:methyl-accepting chemotaxis protein